MLWSIRYALIGCGTATKFICLSRQALFSSPIPRCTLRHGRSRQAFCSWQGTIPGMSHALKFLATLAKRRRTEQPARGATGGAGKVLVFEHCISTNVIGEAERAGKRKCCTLLALVRGAQLASVHVDQCERLWKKRRQIQPGYSVDRSSTSGALS